MKKPKSHVVRAPDDSAGYPPKFSKLSFGVKHENQEHEQGFGRKRARKKKIAAIISKSRKGS